MFCFHCSWPGAMLRGGHPGSHAANGPQHPPPPSVSLGYRGLPPQAPSSVPSTSGPHPPPPQPCPPPAHDLSNLPPGVREIKPINPASLGGGYSTAHGESSFLPFTFAYSKTCNARTRHCTKFLVWTIYIFICKSTWNYLICVLITMSRFLLFSR